MEDQMKGQVCDEKMCGMNGCGFGRHNGWYHLIRWILVVAIILIVFCFGMMIGQLRGELLRYRGDDGVPVARQRREADRAG